MIKSFTVKIEDPTGDISMDTLYDSIIEGISEFGYEIADLVIVDNDTKQSLHMRDIEKMV